MFGVLGKGSFLGMGGYVDVWSAREWSFLGIWGGYIYTWVVGGGVFLGLGVGVC
jgi:hypothetical protein